MLSTNKDLLFSGSAFALILSMYLPLPSLAMGEGDGTPNATSSPVLKKRKLEEGEQAATAQVTSPSLTTNFSSSSSISCVSPPATSSSEAENLLHSMISAGKKEKTSNKKGEDANSSERSRSPESLEVVDWPSDEDEDEDEDEVVSKKEDAKNNPSSSLQSSRSSSSCSSSMPSSSSSPQVRKTNSSSSVSPLPE